MHILRSVHPPQCDVKIPWKIPIDHTYDANMLMRRMGGNSTRRSRRIVEKDNFATTLFLVYALRSFSHSSVCCASCSAPLGPCCSMGPRLAPSLHPPVFDRDSLGPCVGGSAPRVRSINLRSCARPFEHLSLRCVEAPRRAVQRNLFSRDSDRSVGSLNFLLRTKIISFSFIHILFSFLIPHSSFFLLLSSFFFLLLSSSSFCLLSSVFCLLSSFL